MPKYKLQEMYDVRALAVIARDGFIGLTDYAAINNLSRTSASEDLKRICANPEGPLDTKGRGSHKVWVKRKGMRST